ncbi:MAG: GNAT family N-acetyltransferase [Candidatus Andersenbacteria bacterium]|nr:GNAT family N-acetyltransferase [Candidatus Andersenbacteria bacterium]
MDTTLQIREANVTDISHLIRLTLELAHDTGAHLNRRVLENGITRFLGEECHGKYFVLTKQDQPVGQLIIKPVVFEPWRNSRIVWVDDFQVTHPYNTRSNMKRLLEYGIQWAVEQEPQQVVRLHCPMAHPNMLNTLSRLGFEAIGYLMEQSQDFCFDEKTSPYHIREATQNDHEVIMRNTMSLAAVTSDDVNRKVLKDGVSRFLQDQTYGKYFLAFDDEKPVGQMLIKHTLMEPWHNSRVIWVDDTYIDTKYRGKNITRFLLQKGIEWAVKGQAEQIARLYCAFSNIGGVVSWTNLGFKPIGFMMQQRQDVDLVD